MSSNGSLNEQGSTSQNQKFEFIEQGRDIICMVGEMTFRVLSHQWAAGRMKAGISIEKAGTILSQDCFTLDSKQSRDKFLEPFSAAEKDALGKAIFQLHEYLRSKPQPDPSQTNQGQAIFFEEVDPWPEPVAGGALLDELTAMFSKYAKLPKHGEEVLALFTEHTYTLDAAESSPYIGLNSPKRRCGKSLIEEILTETVFRPLMTSNITSAALFRTIEKFHPTVLIDEADSFLEMSDDLRGVLDSGHRRKGAFVIRTEGDNHEPRKFSTWACKVYAMIGKAPDTVRDRSIELKMKRMTKDEKKKLQRLQFTSKKIQNEFLILRRRLTRWAKDNLDALVGADPVMPEELNDRAQDCWRPLFAIAEHAGGNWLQKTREAALALSGEDSSDDEGLAGQLLEDLRNYFSKEKADTAFTEDILTHLSKIEERAWPEFNHGKPISSRQLANLLRPFGIASGQVRIEETSKKGYRLEAFQDAFARYLPPLEAKQTKQSNIDAGSSDFLEAKQEANVSDEKSEENADEQRLVSDVSDENPELQVEEEFSI